MFLFPSETITYLNKSLVPVLITKSKYQNSWNIGRHNCSWFIKTLPKFFFCQINWKTQIICFSASLSPFCNSGNRRHLAADWSTLPKKSSSHHQQLFRLFLRLSVQLRAQSGRKSKVGEFRKLFLKKIRNSSKMKACMLTYLVYCLQRRIGNVCCADTKREWCSLTRPGFNQRPKVQRQFRIWNLLG